jgi:uncharacterized protein YneF (UPF0154 family)
MKRNALKGLPIIGQDKILAQRQKKTVIHEKCKKWRSDQDIPKVPYSMALALIKGTIQGVEYSLTMGTWLAARTFYSKEAKKWVVSHIDEEQWKVMLKQGGLSKERIKENMRPADKLMLEKVAEQ